MNVAEDHIQSSRDSTGEYISGAWFGLPWFYGISTFVGYLMPNPFLYIYTVLFQTIQFSIQKQFYFKQFSLA